MVSILMKLHKHTKGIQVRFLVFKELVLEFLLGIDGQWPVENSIGQRARSGMPISLSCSKMEALVNLGAVHLNDAF
jgi:hypothetical protein